MENIKEKLIEQFRDTMKFIMWNELLFTNRVHPKAFALLKPKFGSDNNIHIGMRGINENEPENFIDSLDEGRTKISLTNIVNEYKQNAIADGHDVISICLIDVYEIVNDSHYVYVMYNDFVDGSNAFNKSIEIHKLVRGESVVQPNGEVGQKKSQLTFNHA